MKRITTFAKRLKELRQERELSQVALSEEVGIGKSAIGSWELNQNDPLLENTIKLAEFFGVTLSYMAGFDE